jgi:hypothetical protein
MMRGVVVSVAALCLASWLGMSRAEGPAPTYVGLKKCKVCHKAVYKTWEATEHAKAFERLKGDEAKDPKCIECHTTAKDAKFPAVQCEACHGPGKGYSNIKIMNKKKWKADPEGQRKLALEAGLVVAPDEKNCTQCHNERSPHYEGFDFKARYEEIGHKEGE